MTTPSRNNRAEWSWSSIRMSNNTSSSAANTPVNHVDIESALTANAIRDRVPSPPPISASASASNSAVCAANRSNGTPAAVGLTWLLPHHQNLADPLLQRLDPLTDRRWRHVQTRRGRVEPAVFDHRGERGQLLTVELHISNTNAYEESLAVLICPALLPSKP